MNRNHQNPRVCSDAPIQTGQEKIYTSSELLGASSSVLIDHHGVIYTLRITQFGKLILTK
jgi:hemin uptake protein HemP